MRAPLGPQKRAGRPNRPGRRSRRSDQRGSASIWALLLTAGAFTLLLGLIVDGGHVIDERLASSRAAAQAARAGADELSASSTRSGHDQVQVTRAITRVQAYLHQARMSGTAHVEGTEVSVTVTGRSPTQILGVLGIDSFPIRETRTARAITGQEAP